VASVRDVSTITTADALRELLDQFGWFEDGQCMRISPLPGGAPVPARVELVLRDFGTGSLWAGEIRTYQVLRLTATEVQDWSVEGDDFHHFPEHVMEGAMPVEDPAGFGFTLDVPTPVRLVARSFEFNRLPAVTEKVAARTSDRELHVSAPRANLPTPAAWVEALAREGIAVAWRIYGDAATPTEQVPSKEYVGWFLERPSRLSEDDGGIFFRWVAEDAGRVTLVLERWGADDELWLGSCRSAVSNFPEGEFSSGNCRFSARSWLAHLAAQ
jgi:hypothetical protein